MSSRRLLPLQRGELSKMPKTTRGLAPFAPNWITHFSSREQRWFYKNLVTGETTWKCPPALSGRTDSAAIKAVGEDVKASMAAAESKADTSPALVDEEAIAEAHRVADLVLGLGLGLADMTEPVNATTAVATNKKMVLIRSTRSATAGLKDVKKEVHEKDDNLAEQLKKFDEDLAKTVRFEDDKKEVKKKLNVRVQTKRQVGTPQNPSTK
jgi:WW domain